MKKGIIFDMDGTLWDSAEKVAASWTEALQNILHMDLTITTEQIKNVMGKTMDVIAELLFGAYENPSEILEVCAKYENDYLREHGGILYPKLEETLRQLQKEYHLYIVSNCQSGYIEAFLAYYDFGQYFEDIECFGNNKKQKGENIRLLAERNQLEQAVYVGDVQGDYDATMEAGLPFIYAAYGFGSIDHEVPSIQTFAELPKCVEQIFS